MTIIIIICFSLGQQQCGASTTSATDTAPGSCSIRQGLYNFSVTFFGVQIITSQGSSSNVVVVVS